MKNIILVYLFTGILQFQAFGNPVGPASPVAVRVVYDCEDAPGAVFCKKNEKFRGFRGLVSELRKANYSVVGDDSPNACATVIALSKGNCFRGIEDELPFVQKVVKEYYKKDHPVVVVLNCSGYNVGNFNPGPVLYHVNKTFDIPQFIVRRSQDGEKSRPEDVAVFRDKFLEEHCLPTQHTDGSNKDPSPDL